MKMGDPPINVEQVFTVPPEKVWSAITEIDQMRQWFFDNIPEFKAEIGFETRFTVNSGKSDFVHLWKITEVIPLKRITYNWKYEDYLGDSFVNFALSEHHKGQTTLTLTVEIVEDFPQDIPEFKRESGVAGWNYFIAERLRAYLEV